MCERAPSRTERLAGVALLAAALAGCATNPAPERWRPSIGEAAHTPLGTWAVAELTDKVTVSGELLAASSAGVVLQDWRYLGTYETLEIERLRVYPFHQPWGYAAAVGSLGTLSTLSHGFFLVFSAPAWILTTSATAAVDSHIGQERFGRREAQPLQAARKYARFPQGLPDGYFERHLCPRPGSTPCYLARPGAPPASAPPAQPPASAPLPVPAAPRTP